jgi:muramidase (phage lysozyme)
MRSQQPTSYLFRNLNLLDPRFEETRGGYEVLVEGGHFKEVSERPIKSATAQVIDCAGGTLSSKVAFTSAIDLMD